MGEQIFQHYIRMLGRWWWLLLISSLIPMMVSYGLLSQKPPLYQARATLMVGTSLQTANPDPWQMNLSTTLAGAYAELAKQRPVLEAVIDRLALPRTPEQLVQQIETRIYSGAQLLEIRVVDTDPDVAALVANALADELSAAARPLAPVIRSSRPSSAARWPICAPGLRAWMRRLPD